MQPDFFKNNADPKCPACKQILKKPSVRYLNMLCPECMKLITNTSYQRIIFIKNNHNGIDGFYLDNNGNPDVNRRVDSPNCCIMIGGYNVNCSVYWDTQICICPLF